MLMRGTSGRAGSGCGRGAGGMLRGGRAAAHLRRIQSRTLCATLTCPSRMKHCSSVVRLCSIGAGAQMSV